MSGGTCKPIKIPEDILRYLQERNIKPQRYQPYELKVIYEHWVEPGKRQLAKKLGRAERTCKALYHKLKDYEKNLKHPLEDIDFTAISKEL